MVANRGLLIVGVPYVGFAAGYGLLAVLTAPEYEHIWYLDFGVIWLVWSIVAVVSVAISLISIRRHASGLRGRVQWLMAALQAPVILAVIGLAPFSIACLQAYNAGFVAYDAAFKACDGPPVLAWGGWGAHITLASDSDYDRLKYSTKDFLQFGPRAVYFCTAADAEAHGYPMFS